MELLKILDEYKKDVIELYGEKLVSIYLYGSAATPSFIPGVSDLNFLIILDEVNINDLKLYHRIHAKWVKKKVAPPIIATPDYLYRSTDVFPLEFSEIMENHILVFGKDLVNSIDIQAGNLRLQVESELKGKLLKFRQGIIFLSNDTTEFKRFFVRTVTSFVPVFRGVLRLFNVKPPYDFLELAKKLEEQTGFSSSILEKAWEIKKGAPISHDDLNNVTYQFHEELEKLIDLVDRLKVK